MMMGVHQMLLLLLFVVGCHAMMSGRRWGSDPAAIVIVSKLVTLEALRFL